MRSRRRLITVKTVINLILVNFRSYSTIFGTQIDTPYLAIVVFLWPRVLTYDYDINITSDQDRRKRRKVKGKISKLSYLKLIFIVCVLNFIFLEIQDKRTYSSSNNKNNLISIINLLALPCITSIMCFSFNNLFISLLISTSVAYDLIRQMI